MQDVSVTASACPTHELRLRFLAGFWTLPGGCSAAILPIVLIGTPVYQVCDRLPVVM